MITEAPEERKSQSKEQRQEKKMADRKQDKELYQEYQNLRGELKIRERTFLHPEDYEPDELDKVGMVVKNKCAKC